jgi:hypothetical protein
MMLSLFLGLRMQGLPKERNEKIEEKLYFLMISIMPEVKMK